MPNRYGPDRQGQGCSPVAAVVAGAGNESQPGPCQQ